MKRVAFYVRVSQDSQTVENQLQVLREIAERSGWIIVHTFADEGISGAKGRDQRPGFDALLKAVARREIDLVAAWSVDRLGRSLGDLIAFLGDIQKTGCDLYLHQQALDTSTPSGRMLFGMLGVFAEFERSMIVARVRAGQDRARAKGVRFRVPGGLVEKVGRTHWVRSLGTGYRDEAVRRARIAETKGLLAPVVTNGIDAVVGSGQAPC